MTNLETSILKTLAYFDIFKYPLTLQEIQLHLINASKEPLPSRPPALSQLESTLNNLPAVSHDRGFYFLQQSESTQARAPELITERLKRYDIAETKWQILIPKIRTLATLPWVRAIFVVNTLAWSYARAESDIDLLIITSPHHIWTARQWATGYAALKHDRPTPQHETNTLCLSFYLSGDNLNLAPIKIRQDDVYVTFWLAQLHPVYDPENYLKRLWDVNPWLAQQLPYAKPVQPDHRRKIELNSVRRISKKILELAQPKSFESIYKKWQMRIMPKHLKQQANRSPGVVISDSMLKFHDKDKREYLYQAWQTKVHILTSG